MGNSLEPLEWCLDVGGSGQLQVRGARQREVSRAMVVKSVVHVLYRLHLKNILNILFYIFIFSLCSHRYSSGSDNKSACNVIFLFLRARCLHRQHRQPFASPITRHHLKAWITPCRDTTSKTTYHLDVTCIAAEAVTIERFASRTPESSAKCYSSNEQWARRAN